MDRINQRLLIILLGIMCSLVFVMAYGAESSLNSPIGYWRTLDEVTGKPKSIIRIWKDENNKLQGKVIKVFTSDGSDPTTKICSACTGIMHNQPIIGMVVLTGLTAKKQQWGNGQIVDPENGKSYKCALRTLENGKKLHVRGYLGLPLLGRSQTWERLDLAG